MKKRNPIAKAVTRIRPQVIPDKRGKIVTKAVTKEVRRDIERD